MEKGRSILILKKRPTDDASNFRTIVIFYTIYKLIKVY